MDRSTDIASVARRLVEDTRRNNGTAPTVFLSAEDAHALLPILDAVAAGVDADKVDRWRAAQEWDTYPATTPGMVGWSIQTERIKGAIALADAERAARKEVGWRAYEFYRDDLVAASRITGGVDFASALADQAVEDAGGVARAVAAMDAAVKALAGC